MSTYNELQVQLEGILENSRRVQHEVFELLQAQSSFRNMIQADNNRHTSRRLDQKSQYLTGHISRNREVECLRFPNRILLPSSTPADEVLNSAIVISNNLKILTDYRDLLVAHNRLALTMV